MCPSRGGTPPLLNLLRIKTQDLMTDLIEELQELGLPGREAEIYIALLQKKEFTAPEISKITSVSRSKCYELLQNLVRKNLCNAHLKNGIKYFSGVDPEIAIKNILSVYEDELERKKKFAYNCKKKLKSLHKKKVSLSDPLDYIEFVSHPKQIRERWLEIQASSKKELLLFAKAPYVVTLNENLENEAAVIEQKVICKGIYEYKGLNTKEEKETFIKTIEAFQRLGEETRLVKELPMKLVISDDFITMFSLNDRVSLTSSFTSIIVNHPSFAAALKTVFESYWKIGITLKEFKKIVL